MPRKRQIMRNPNNYGTIKKLSGNRRRPWMVGVNPKINDKGTYTYDILGYYEDRTEAMIALAEYNKNPVDLTNKNITFEEVYRLYYEDKYVKSKKKLSKASETSTRTAFNNCKEIHNRKFLDLRHSDLQQVIDDCPLRHASLELILTLFKGMYAFAMKEDITQRNHAEFVKINIEDDDEHGVRFTNESVASLWEHTEVFPFTKVILIYLYTGWRAREFSEMKKESIDLDNMIMTGGLKTKAGKNRVVPIHPKIQGFVRELYNASDNEYILPSKKGAMSYFKLYTYFMQTLSDVGIKEKYTLHDCRHTFDSWLDDAGVPNTIRNLLMGHSGEGIDEKVYIHKTIEQLREAIEKLP
ncbi:MAG: tyrosine-type recombinase/integrase [Lachnospiraceae bacterium]|nr:tyrosine-type recombinase/integrase [Lachnospiraceae bacterium]